MLVFFFFFNDTATTEIYTLSLHDALPIWITASQTSGCRSYPRTLSRTPLDRPTERPISAWRYSGPCQRSEEHTSELQSQSNLVCRLLLEKKKYDQPLIESFRSSAAVWIWR